MSDIRALLLTDVVDSTRLSERLGDMAMTEVWASHDRAARDLLPRWRGLEIDKTDGMLLLFDDAADAVRYAVDYQQALAALPVPLKARAGLHVGPVILRENAPADVARGAKPLEVDGIAKPTAARVMCLAQGGQILLTMKARQALGDRVPNGLTVHSHGCWAVKGVTEPIELFEIGTDSAPFAAPPDTDKVWRVAKSGGRWMPVNQMPNNLPQQFTSFVGRERELAEVKALMAQTRLVTLLGMGGLGKTRLSLQAAAEVMPEFPDGVWFLDLAPIRDPALVVDEAAQALGVREAADKALLQTVCAYLKTRRLLLIVDNCEHLVQACAELVSAILRAAPGVHAIASSREALHVPGEQAYPVMPLPLPPAGAGVDIATLQQSTAVRLFVDRARLHKPSFELTERDGPAVAELVSRLEGIPLALELAAARVRGMGVADINARVKDRYKLLTGGGRTLLQRQQTLRALVDWSYDLLNRDEQTALGRLSVFAGGFDLEAAEAVCGVDPLQRDDILDLLTSLVEKSLVMLDDRQDVPRYRMLETIVDYGREKLVAAADDDAALTVERHCQHFFAFAKATNRGIKGREQADWVQRMEVELDNVRAAIELSLAGGVEAFVAVKFTVAMLGFWMLRGYSTEGRATVQAALALPAVQNSELAQAWALYVGAALASAQSDHAEARRMLERCLVLRRRLGNPIDIAATLSTLTLARLPAGDAAAAELSEHEALEIFRSNDDRMGEVIALIHLGHIHRHTGESVRAVEHLRHGLAIARDLHNQEAEGECELMLAVLAFEGGDPTSARRHGARSSTVCREAGDRRGEANAQRWLGKIDLDEGLADSAGARLSQALRAYRDFEMRDELLGCLEDHAALALSQQRSLLAVRLLGLTSLLRERLALVRPPGLHKRWRQLTDTLRQTVPAEAFASAWAEAEGWDVETAIERALAQEAGADERQLSSSPT
ncbi:MAG: hypothetical protein ABIN96_05515 [Rubrivivax sp.]